MRLTAASVAAIALAIVMSSTATASTAHLPLSANGQAKSPDQTNFFINYPADPVYTDWTPTSSPIEEQRAVLEFNLAGLPAGANIQSASLQFNVSLYEYSTVGSTTLYPSLAFWSYAGNNAIDVDDATETHDPVANLIVDDTGPFNVPLNVTRIRSLVDAHAAAIGILTYANSQDLTVGLWTEASPPFIAAPTLAITYLPAGDANSDGRLNGDDFALIDRGFAKHLTGFSNGDFNNDGVINAADYLILDQSFLAEGGTLSPDLLATRASAFGPEYMSDLLAAVPEPGSLAACGGAMLSLLARRRRA